MKRTRNIKFKNEVVVEMTIEDLIKRFDKQIKIFARKCASKIQADEDVEDYMQIGYMTLIKCFEEYDEKYIFSSYFIQKLEGENYKLYKKTTRQKRSAQTVSLQSETNQGSDGEATTLEDIIGTVDEAIESLAGGDLVDRIFNTLNNDEKHMYLNIIENGVKASSYAYAMGISRQSLNYKLKKLKEKLSNLYMSYTAMA